MALKVKFDVEERRELKDITLQMLEEGRSKERIAEKLGVSFKSIKNFILELIKEGRTTQSKIDNARNARIEEENGYKKQEALESFKQGIPMEQTSKRLHINMKYMKKRLIEDGLITEEEIRKARERRKEHEKEEKKKSNGNVDIEKIANEVLKLLLLGIKNPYIKKILKLNSIDIIKDATKLLINKGMITKEKIKEAKENREKEIRQIISTLIDKGYTYKEISKKIPYADEEEIIGVVRKIKREGTITSKEVEEKRLTANKKDPQKRRSIILEGLREGKSYKEICEIAKKQNIVLTEEIIQKIKIKLVAEGEITNEEIRKVKKAVELSKNEEKRINFVRSI